MTGPAGRVGWGEEAAEGLRGLTAQIRERS